MLITTLTDTNSKSNVFVTAVFQTDDFVFLLYIRDFSNIFGCALCICAYSHSFFPLLSCSLSLSLSLSLSHSLSRSLKHTQTHTHSRIIACCCFISKCQMHVFCCVRCV